MRADVHFQRSQGHIRFLAVFAREFFTRVLVFSQSSFGDETPLAVVTFMFLNRANLRGRNHRFLVIFQCLFTNVICGLLLVCRSCLRCSFADVILQRIGCNFSGINICFPKPYPWLQSCGFVNRFWKNGRIWHSFAFEVKLATCWPKRKRVT